MECFELELENAQRGVLVHFRFFFSLTSEIPCLLVCPSLRDDNLCRRPTFSLYLIEYWKFVEMILALCLKINTSLSILIFV